MSQSKQPAPIEQPIFDIKASPLIYDVWSVFANDTNVRLSRVWRQALVKEMPTFLRPYIFAIRKPFQKAFVSGRFRTLPNSEKSKLQESILQRHIFSQSLSSLATRDISPNLLRQSHNGDFVFQLKCAYMDLFHSNAWDSHTCLGVPLFAPELYFGDFLALFSHHFSLFDETFIESGESFFPDQKERETILQSLNINLDNLDQLSDNQKEQLRQAISHTINQNILKAYHKHSLTDDRFKPLSRHLCIYKSKEPHDEPMPYILCRKNDPTQSPILTFKTMPCYFC